jgi:hypothetical protein
LIPKRKEGFVVPRLFVFGKKIALELQFDGAISVGRHIANSLPLPDPEVSRHHAQIFPRQGEFVIHDLGSRNGILVNGEKAGEHILEAGDEILLGASLLVYEPADPDQIESRLSKAGAKLWEEIKPEDAPGKAEVSTFSVAELRLMTQKWLNRETKPPLLPGRLRSDLLKFVLRLDDYSNRGEVCQAALEFLDERIGAHRGAVIAPQKKKKSLELWARAGGDSKGKEAELLLDPPIHKDILRVALDAGKAIYSANCATDFRFKHLVHKDDKYLLQSFITVPIFCGKEYCGLIYLDQPAGGPKYDFKGMLTAWLTGSVLGKALHWRALGKGREED